MDISTEHRFCISGRCPVNPSIRDDYEVTVRIEETADASKFTPVSVEEIRDAASTILAQPVFQETFTAMLATMLGAYVRTTGMHGDFQTTCEANPS